MVMSQNIKCILITAYYIITKKSTMEFKPIACTYILYCIGKVLYLYCIYIIVNYCIYLLSNCTV